MRIALLLSFVAATALNAQSSAAPPTINPTVYDIVGAVSPDRIEADIRRLVGFGTRNTLSDTLSATRGIGAARRWVKAEFDGIAAACGGCLEVFYLDEVFDSTNSRRIPRPTNVVNVVAIQRGTGDPNRFVVMAGDIDNRISSTLNAADSSPGANDNASGMAGTIEAARVLTQHRFHGSIMYLGLSGEEQGLFGGRTVARHARENDWTIVGVLNNDMIGNIQGISGVTENQTARVFSQPTPMNPTIRAQVDETLDVIRRLAAGEAVENNGRPVTLDMALSQMRRLTDLQWQRFRRGGGEVDGTSRQLARYVDRMADLYLPTLDVMMIYRLDRFGRGGHHTPFNNEGFPGVRIMETNENYDRQHQDIRVENGVHYGDVIAGVDFDYAAKLTGLNAATLASLAGAPRPPADVRIAGAVRPAATLMWNAPADAGRVAGYKVYWRATDSPTWDYSRWVGLPTAWPGKDRMRQPPAYGHRFDGLVIDNFYFGVAAVAADGSESTVVFPLP